MSIRQFTIEDQKVFAELSGDHNPMHVDPIEARRTLFGEAVVHGVHALIWALDQYKDISKFSLKELKATFHQPIALNTEIDCKWENLGDLKFSVKILHSDKLLSSLQVSFQEHSSSTPNAFEQNNKTSSPDVVSLEDCLKLNGQISYRWNRTLIKQLFPNLLHYRYITHLSFLLTSTELVGMKCPGYYSLYSSLQVSFDPEDDNQPFSQYRVSKTDPRFNMVYLHLQSEHCKANIKAFFRPRPTQGISFKEAQKSVVKHEFNHQNALIIGGSRGLGATTAKLLKAGGAEVTITYAHGKGEAESIQAEVQQAGMKLDYFQCDLMKANQAYQSIPNQPFTHIYYFASPKIKSNEGADFDQELYEHYKYFYRTQFKNCIEHFYTDHLQFILYPSTIFIEEQPKNMREYVQAKAEGEHFCSDWQSTHTKIEVSAPRFPKLATDQTADLKAVDQLSPLESIYSSLPKK